MDRTGQSLGALPYSGLSSHPACFPMTSLLLTLATAAFTFSDGPGGGVAELRFDAAQDRIEMPTVLWSDARFAHPGKVRALDGGGWAAVSEHEDKANLVLLSGKGEPPQVLDLPGQPDEIRASEPGMLLIGSSGGWLHRVNTRAGQRDASWNARDGLRPPGHRVEDILLLGNFRALLTFQKDSSSGKYLGSRVVIFDPIRMEAAHDLPLPRDRPEVHLAGSRKDQGPGPEVILISESANTVFITLDLYGAVAFADADALLQQGRWNRLDYLPVAEDGSWGTAFPDRAVLVRHGARDYAAVANAGQPASCVLIDLAARRIVARFPTAAGCEPPVVLPALQLLATVESGKSKTRGTTTVEKSQRPGSALHLLHFEATGDFRHERVELGAAARLCAAAGERHLLLALDREDGGSDWVLYDPVARRETARVASPGAPARLALR